MFNYNKNQDDEQVDPRPNNYCGGYALAAVIKNLRSRDVIPSVTYNQIQLWQNHIGPNSTALILQSVINGTNICLPSSIVYCMRNVYFLQSIVYYTQNAGTIIPQNTINEEIFRLGVLAVNSGNHNLQQILQGGGEYSTRYWIVLVNGGGHWIAIKKEDNLFYGYDPAGGRDEQITINGNNINGNNINGNNIHYIWSEICIAV